MNRYDGIMGLSPRAVFAGIFVVCAALIAYALYLQHAQGLEPCPMCILQRYAFIGVAVVALIAVIQGPHGLAAVAYGGGVVLLAVVGGGIAAWHSWLQRYPPESFSCGTDLWYLLDTFPLASALPAIFEGTGDCSEVVWRLLGLSIPEWALAWFVILAVVGLLTALKARRAR